MVKAKKIFAVTIRQANRKKLLLLSLLLTISISSLTPVSAGDGVLFVSVDHPEGYDRSLFKHWIDADNDGCDTRKEVLIQEAITKPKIGKKCALSGGKWVSAYDGKTHTKDSGLDVDHVVPLAEAWRSGAWAWTEKEREVYANYIDDEWALNAVTASVNRSKGDKDISSWLPKVNVCKYLLSWVQVKSHFNLSVDTSEAKVIEKYYSSCGLGYITKQSSKTDPSAIPTISSTPSSATNIVSYDISEIQLNTQKLKFGGSLEVKFRVKSNDLNPQPIYCLVDMVANPFEASLVSGDKRDGIWSCDRSIPSSPMERQSSGKYEVQILIVFSQNGQKDEIRKPIAVIQDASIPSPTPTTALVTPGAFCSPAGAMGKSSSGVSYTCKSSPSDSRNRWRQ